MRILLLLLMILVVGCATKEPSKSITSCAINDINGIQVSIDNLEKATTNECKTDAFNVRISSIKSQVSSVAGQIKNIQTACQTEKEVLKEKIIARNFCIFSLITLIVLLIGLIISRKLRISA